MQARKILIGLAGAAATVSLAAPAAAQYPYGYPQRGGVVGQILNNVLGYGQYPYGNYGYGQQGYMGSQVAINQCARAAEARLNGGYGGYAYNRGARVVGIDRVEVRGYGRLKVTGVATSGRNYSNPWGYGSYAYNRSYGVPDLRFTCRADRGGRITSLNFSRLNRRY